jgi:2-C-methyl-D-erythritol 2,4-cyclodiphosphate synthase
VIPYEVGLEGHSDADTLTHAVIDAIIGALGMGDIGRHFPDDNPKYKDVASLSMLRTVMEWVKRDEFRVNNVDATIVAQEPKLAPYISQMQEKIADVLGMVKERVNIKATTAERLGFSGRREGIEAFAVIGLVKEIPAA